MSNIQNRQLIDWEKFRESVRKSTAIDLSETAEEKKKRIARLEADPQAWKQYYFPKYFKYKSPGFHIEASKRLHKQFRKNKHWYEVRHWARGLSKSTTCMFDILFLVMTGQLKNIIQTSSTYDAAEGFLTKYQVQLDSNQRLISDYGKQELPGSWTAGNFTTRSGAKFIALGAGQSPRGNGNEEIRPDCIIVDDFDTDEECRNPDIINKKWDWFEKALFFTVDTAEPYLIIWLGNIIAEDCCVVRAGQVADHTEIINIRDENNKSVWPEKNSEADIDYQISKVSYESSQQEMFNNPIRQGQTFKEMKWGKCPPLKQLSFAVVYADPSPSNKDKPTLKSKLQNSCKAVFVIGFKDSRFYVYTGYLDNTTNANFIDWLYTSREYVNGETQTFYYIENNTLQNPFYEQVLLPLIYQKGNAINNVLPITPDDRDKPDKWIRIEGTLEPLNRLGLLILNEEEKSNPHMKRLEAQFKAASATCKTMDGPDCIEGGVHIIQKKVAVQNVGDITVIRRPVNPKKYYTMPFLQKEDFKTHIYAELIAEITRSDDDIITKGISAAIGEAKGYLSRYDLLKIFGNATTEPEVEEALIEYLKSIVKDLACWQMVKLSNPNIDLKLIRTSYEDAIKWLEKVQKGMVDPEGWPYKADDPETDANENSGIQWSSNKKRIQHY